MKPLLIDTNLLLPYVDKSLHNTFCSSCDKPQAKWDMIDPNLVDKQGNMRPTAFPVCSICFLYESNWGVDRKDQVREVVDEFERIRRADQDKKYKEELEARKKSGSVIVLPEPAAFSYSRDMAGRLSDIRDADNILLYIAWVSRQELLKHQKREAVKAAK